MNNVAKPVKTLLRAASFLILLFAIAAHAQDKDADAKAKAASDSKDVRLTIVVTGGDEKKPVDSASVYVRYVEQRKIGGLGIHLLCKLMDRADYQRRDGRNILTFRIRTDDPNK